MLLSEYSAKRSYTTRAKEEQRRTAAPAFVGRVRPWTKCWAPFGSGLTVPRWVRADQKTEALPPADRAAPAAAALEAEVSLPEGERYEAWRLARIKDRELELEE
eukprot:scaffold58715_cov60-Phaeocystis_antarctica.AAC.1